MIVIDADMVVTVVANDKQLFSCHKDNKGTVMIDLHGTHTYRAYDNETIKQIAQAIVICSNTVTI